MFLSFRLPLLFFFFSTFSTQPCCHAVGTHPFISTFLLDDNNNEKNHDPTNKGESFILITPRVGGPPPRLQIGSIDNQRTEFHVGDGFRDESHSRTIISITDTAGTDHGLVDPITTQQQTQLPGTLYYDFTILAPGCTKLGDARNAIQIRGQYTGSNSVDVALAVYPWHETSHDIHGDQSEFGVCLQADIFIVTSTDGPQLIESKQFDFDVKIVAAVFTLGKKGNERIKLASISRWQWPCT